MQDFLFSNLSSFHTKILTWYKEYGRILPWRYYQEDLQENWRDFSQEKLQDILREYYQENLQQKLNEIIQNALQQSNQHLQPLSNNPKENTEYLYPNKKTDLYKNTIFCNNAFLQTNVLEAYKLNKYLKKESSIFSYLLQQDSNDISPYSWHSRHIQEMVKKANVAHFTESNFAPCNQDSKSQTFNHIRAYRVWISEIMLQQTQVSRVLSLYYFPFLKRFPTLTHLALAQENEILLAWQGLGYYSRARNIAKTAKICLQHYNARLPSNLKDLEALPGIGSYSAGAIMCFGFKQEVSFVDSNIARLLCRIFALHSPTQKTLLSLAKEILNYKHSFQHNQALLDLGAIICLSKNPKCQICPIRDFCQAYHSQKHIDNSTLNPSKTNDFTQFGIQKKIMYEDKKLYLLILSYQEPSIIERISHAKSIRDSKQAYNITQECRDNLRVAMLKSSHKLYKNLYGFIEITHDNIIKFERFYQFLGKFRHSYTKYRLEITLYHCDIDLVFKHIQDYINTISCEFPQNLQSLLAMNANFVDTILKQALNAISCESYNKDSKIEHSKKTSKQGNWWVNISTINSKPYNLITNANINAIKHDAVRHNHAINNLQQLYDFSAFYQESLLPSLQKFPTIQSSFFSLQEINNLALSNLTKKALQILLTNLKINTSKFKTHKL